MLKFTKIDIHKNLHKDHKDYKNHKKKQWGFKFSTFCVFCVVGLLLLIAVKSFAAIDRIIAPDMKRHQYIENGTIVGGESGGPFTLLNVRRLLSAKDKIERVFLDLGNDKGKPLKNKVNYFQVSIDRENSRIVMDLSQMLASGVDSAKIKKIFAASPYVRDAEINYDPLDTTITIQFFLKKKVRIEAFKMVAKDSASRLVLDIKDKG